MIILYIFIWINGNYGAMTFHYDNWDACLRDNDAIMDSLNAVDKEATGLTNAITMCQADKNGYST